MAPLRSLLTAVTRLAVPLGRPRASRPDESPPGGAVASLRLDASCRTTVRASIGRALFGERVVAPRSADEPAARAASRERRTTRQQHGDEGEAYARRYLELAGLTTVATNIRFRDGEIDLVMRDARRSRRRPPVLVFVEVRRRLRASHGGAAGSVTPAKRRRVVAAAAHFLVGLGLRDLPACRFDVVTLEGDPQQGFIVEWIRDAFRDEGQG